MREERLGKTVYKFCCENCANCNVIGKKYLSLALGIIDESYCSNAKTVIFEKPAKCETEIYCKNFKEKN